MTDAALIIALVVLCLAWIEHRASLASEADLYWHLHRQGDQVNELIETISELRRHNTILANAERGKPKVVYVRALREIVNAWCDNEVSVQEFGDVVERCVELLK
ncbi:MAG: hypothetical protein ACXWHZ_15760 [Usitatibacter sp.]